MSSLQPLPYGDGVFHSPGNPGLLEVFSYKPAGYDPITSNMVVVLHGAQRNARDYRDYSRDLADRTGALVIAPHFDKENYSMWRYRTAGMFTKKKHHHHHNNDDDSRRLSEGETLDLAPQEQWLVVILYRCIAQVRAMESSPSMPYHLFAHSAGAQFLHRLLLFRPDPSPASVVIANSGSYTFPEASWDFPYGLRGLPPEMLALSGGGRAAQVLMPLSLLKAFVESRITLASGTMDVLREGPHMDLSELANMQGSNRRERAKSVFEAYRNLAAEQGWDFGWRMVDVPGVGHDGEGMIKSEAVAAAMGLTLTSIDVDGEGGGHHDRHMGPGSQP